MAAHRGPGRAAALLALTIALAGFGACAQGDDAGDIPPLPQELRTLEQREAGCIACHDGRKVPTLAPGTSRTPSGHPPVAVIRAARELRAVMR